MGIFRVGEIKLIRYVNIILGMKNKIYLNKLQLHSHYNKIIKL